ncbi:hypothetical protein LCGC14_0530270 [marine sediment metagenome]|uniref:Glycosyl transferase family 1 domain-containing protein n=1 Tax=marine sediment metagenome TaxID=412755 RepID=A0A0F9SE47_9ZZZZ
MKIFIDAGQKAAVKRMMEACDKMGWNAVSNPKGADVQLSIIRIRSKNSLPIILRLNGVYYDKAENYKGRNIEISKAHSEADAVVYQSNLSQRMCEKYLTKRRTNIYDVVYNGIDSADWDNFEEHDGINIVSCAKWRRHKRLQETIEVFDEFLNHCPKAMLYILGPMRKGTRHVKHPNIIYSDIKNKIEFDEIREVYKTCDMYLHLSKKDSCPSSVTEAIAAGMPVITTNACGGATEMCELTEGCIVVPGESESLEPDYIYKDPYNKLSTDVKNNILKAMLKIAVDKRRVILPEGLTAEYAAKKYINIMEKIV